jgi:hypothetical protein
LKSAGERVASPQSSGSNAEGIHELSFEKIHATIHASDCEDVEPDEYGNAGRKSEHPTETQENDSHADQRGYTRHGKQDHGNGGIPPCLDPKALHAFPQPFPSLPWGCIASRLVLLAPQLKRLGLACFLVKPKTEPFLDTPSPSHVLDHP